MSKLKSNLTRLKDKIKQTFVLLFADDLMYEEGVKGEMQSVLSINWARLKYDYTQVFQQFKK